MPKNSKLDDTVGNILAHCVRHAKERRVKWPTPQEVADFVNEGGKPITGPEISEAFGRAKGGCSKMTHSLKAAVESGLIEYSYRKYWPKGQSPTITQEAIAKAIEGRMTIYEIAQKTGLKPVVARGLLDKAYEKRLVLRFRDGRRLFYERGKK